VLKGKFGYMSPEQANGQKLDRRSDIFALGIILFELLTQRRLFTSDDDMKTLQLVRDCRVPRPSKYNPQISDALDQIVLKALAKERAERYASAGEMYSDVLLYINQNYPGFIPTELSKILRDIFADDIIEDKKKREKLEAEAPATMGQNRQTQEKQNKRGQDTDLTDPGILKPLGTRELANSMADETKTAVSKKNVQLGDASEEKAGEFVFPQRTISEIVLPAPKVSIPMQVSLENTGRRTPVPSTSRSGYTESYETTQHEKVKSRFGLNSVLLLLAISLMAAYYYTSQHPSETREIASSNAKQKPVAEKLEVVAGELNEEIKTESVALTPPIVPTIDYEMVTAGELLSRSPAMAGRAPPGFLTLDAFPRADQIFINNKLLVDENKNPIKTPLRSLKLPIGTHAILIKSSAYQKSWGDQIVIKPDIVLQRDVVLK
jgi:serine/threonine protein kinase